MLVASGVYITEPCFIGFYGKAPDMIASFLHKRLYISLNNSINRGYLWLIKA